MKYIIIILMTFMPLSIAAQLTVNGVVKDNTGETLPGAVVTEIDNPKNVVQTDIDGAFKLTVKSTKSKIEIRFVGYKSLRLSPVDGMVVEMEADDHMLKAVEIVRVGFGNKTRLSNVAAISQVKGDVLRQSPTSNIQNALAGRLPGLFQLQGSGQPGKDAASLSIRGISTYTDVSKDPLVLIDDIPSDISTLSQLSSNDIEDISILKDAGSTSIFGLKGADGVILVTTRRGKVGAPKATFRADVGLKQPTYKNRFLGSYESLKILKETYRNDGNIAALGKHMFSDEAMEHYRLGDDPYRYPDVEWYDLLYRDVSLRQEYNFDIHGGTEAVRYFVSLGYINDGGLLKDVKKSQDFNNDYYQRRYNLRSNFDIQITKDMLFKINANGVFSEINEPHMPNPGENGTFSIFRRVLGGRLVPWAYAPYNPDGSFGQSVDGTFNPLALLSQGGYKREYNNNVNGNMTLSQKLDFITPGLSARGVMALTNRWGMKRELTRPDSDFMAFVYDPDTDSYTPKNTDVYVLKPMSAKETGISPYMQIDTRLDMTYGRKFGKHDVGGYLAANWATERLGKDTPANSMSIIGRFNYNYDSRYIFEVSGSYNGSDRFAKGNRYDFFPAVSLAWNLAQEPYFKNIASKLKIDMLKFRGSYGISGSDKVPGGKYTYLEIYKADSNYPFGEVGDGLTISGISLDKIGNDKVTWEADKKLNVGVDVSMFSSKLYGVFEYYSNKRSDILTTRGTIPLYTGYLSDMLPMMNLGRTQNKGWDLELTWKDKIGKVDYFVRGIASHSKSKILYMDEAPSPYKLSMKTGRPINTLTGYIHDGYYESLEDIANSPYDKNRDVKLGDLKYKDISGPDGVSDGVIDDYDITAIGNSNPDLNYGISFGITYKNFDISTLFQGATGAYLSIEQIMRVGSTDGRPRPIHKQRWTEYDENDNLVTDPQQLIEMNKNAKFPRLRNQNEGNSARSTYWLRPANYLRWKNLEIGYKLPTDITKKVKLSSVRFYATAVNLLTWHTLGKDYEIDPESSKSGYDTYPQQRVYNFGCQITF